MSLHLALALNLLVTQPQLQDPEPPTFGPIAADPVAVKAQERLLGKHLLIDALVVYGSDATTKPVSRFRSSWLQSKLSAGRWWSPRRPFDARPDFELTGSEFDLADAYAFCSIANLELSFPAFGQDGERLREWPVEKIKRQFQRALARCKPLSLEEKEHLYLALMKSGSIAQEWWVAISNAVTARGDVAGDSRKSAEKVVTWLLGVAPDQIETQYMAAGLRRVVKPRPKF